MSRIKHPISFVYGFFHENVKKRLDAQISRIKHPMSFVYGFFHENVKKRLDTQMSRIKHPMSFLSGFFYGNVKKSSIPKCQELGIRYHLSMDFPWKRQKKLDAQMSRIKHPMTFVYWFFHENVKKKLDTQMSRIKHPMSFLSGFFHENVKKARYPNVRN